MSGSFANDFEHVNDTPEAGFIGEQFLRCSVLAREAGDLSRRLEHVLQPRSIRRRNTAPRPIEGLRRGSSGSGL
jgi:hypothetical protein